MATHEALIMDDSLIAGVREKKISNVYIVRVAPLMLEREVNTNPVYIIELFPEFRDENGEYGAGKERRVFEAILPFGDNQIPPRRYPLETQWTKKRS